MLGQGVPRANPRALGLWTGTDAAAGPDQARHVLEYLEVPARSTSLPRRALVPFSLCADLDCGDNVLTSLCPFIHHQVHIPPLNDWKSTSATPWLSSGVGLASPLGPVQRATSNLTSLAPGWCALLPRIRSSFYVGRISISAFVLPCQLGKIDGGSILLPPPPPIFIHPLRSRLSTSHHQQPWL